MSESGHSDSTRLGFTVANLTEVLETMRAIDAPLLQPVKTTRWGVRAVVRDPDGRGVELIQRTWPTGAFKRVEAEAEFHALLQAERTIIFIWVPWSGPVRHAEIMLRQWAQEHGPVAVHRVDPEEQPFVMQWLTEQGKGDLTIPGSGPLLWLRHGTIVATIISPLGTSREKLDWLTEHAFEGGQ